VDRMRFSVVRGLAAFRWLAWAWMATVLLLARGQLVAPIAAWSLVTAALVVTIGATVLLQQSPERLFTWPVVGVEIAVAAALQVADGFVYRAGHVFTPEQPLGVGWPIAAVLSAGVAFGPGIGAGAGILLGLARSVSSISNVVPDPDPWVGVLTATQALSLVSTMVLYGLAGGIAGYAMHLIRTAETRIADAERAVARLRAREDVARRLHDGVLQTLAVVERRTDDEQLARLARDQERELRTLLFGLPDSGVIGRGALGDALRAAADRVERHHGLRVEVLVPDDLPELPASLLDALVGAAGEALTNAGKHARAGQVVVYVEPDTAEVFVSVRDDGIGFDPAVTVPGVGLTRSIRGRIVEVGGQVEVASTPGQGTEVRLRVPVDG
jgi:signal transduction histidine kinase